MLPKLRKRWLEIKDGFLDAKIETMNPAIILTSDILIYVMYFTLVFIGYTLYASNMKIIAYEISALAIIGLIACLHPKVYAEIFFKCMDILLHYFGKYGRVVTKKDWIKIKKKASKKFYKNLHSKKSFGYCYFYSRGIALFLEDAELMYCSIKKKSGEDTGHAVVVKNHCVYDTNLRRHFDYDEYVEMFNTKLYRMFSAEEYQKESFFDDIRAGFVKWCAENNVYCDPQ